MLLGARTAAWSGGKKIPCLRNTIRDYTTFINMGETSSTDTFEFRYAKDAGTDRFIICGTAGQSGRFLWITNNMVLSDPRYEIKDGEFHTYKFGNGGIFLDDTKIGNGVIQAPNQFFILATNGFGGSYSWGWIQWARKYDGNGNLVMDCRPQKNNTLLDIVNNIVVSTTNGYWQYEEI